MWGGQGSNDNLLTHLSQIQTFPSSTSRFLRIGILDTADNTYIHTFQMPNSTPNHDYAEYTGALGNPPLYEQTVTYTFTTEKIIRIELIDQYFETDYDKWGNYRT
jgi:hypothetical protein